MGFLRPDIPVIITMHTTVTAYLQPPQPFHTLSTQLTQFHQTSRWNKG